MTTKENLRTAIIAESKAYIRYMASMLIARREGKTRAARLFSALAEAEAIHAINHLNVLGELSSTEVNIESAMAFEEFEHSTMYPEFVLQAERDENSLAILSFRGALAGEVAHRRLLQTLKDEPSDGNDSTYYYCPKCGDIEYALFPATCPACGLDGREFKEIP